MFFRKNWPEKFRKTRSEHLYRKSFLKWNCKPIGCIFVNKETAAQFFDVDILGFLKDSFFKGHLRRLTAAICYKTEHVLQIAIARLLQISY